MARYEVDMYYAPLLTACWLYAEARQGSRDMQRVGMTYIPERGQMWA